MKYYIQFWSDPVKWICENSAFSDENQDLTLVVHWFQPEGFLQKCQTFRAVFVPCCQVPRVDGYEPTRSSGFAFFLLLSDAMHAGGLAAYGGYRRWPPDAAKGNNCETGPHVWYSGCETRQRRAAAGFELSSAKGVTHARVKKRKGLLIHGRTGVGPST